MGRRPRAGPGVRVLAAAALGYGAGLIPSASLASRLATGGGVDLRMAGSGNPGATNAAAQLGTGWGLAVLGLDMGKGAAAGAVGQALGGTAGGCAAGTASIAGHVFPATSGFRGGKGVATSAGASLVLFPAYFPLDVVVAYLSARRTANADRAIQLSCGAWTAAALVWWRRGLSNAWGPTPTAAVPIFAGASSAVMLARLALNARQTRSS